MSFYDYFLSASFLWRAIFQTLEPVEFGAGQCFAEPETKIQTLSTGFCFLDSCNFGYRCWGQDIGYPQGEKDSASTYNRSTSMATSIFP